MNIQQSNITKWFFIISAIAILNSACNKQDDNQTQTKPEYNTNYFPLELGTWREYEVIHIVIDEPSEVWDTSHYQLREVGAEWILDATDDTVMRIERFARDSNHHPWTPLSVWQASIKESNAFQTEENNKYLKIKFPAKLNAQWNGNIYNRLDTIIEYQYTITYIDAAATVNDITFDSTLTVTQKDKATIIDKVEFFETYAYGVGLINRQQIDIYSEDVDASIPIEQRVTKGTMYYQKIIRYGK